MSLFPIWLIHSFRLFRHELKRGELTVVALAIVLSVVAVFTLTGFAEQIRYSLSAQSSKFIAADRVLTSSREIKPEILEKAKDSDIALAQQVEMASMLFAGDKMLMASVKASSTGYPLKGELLVKTNIQESAKPVSAPTVGNIWLEEKAFNRLGIELGALIDIGIKQFKVAGIIEHIPDASFNVFSANPVVILNIEDLPATQLVLPGSRVTYKYLFAGEQEKLEEFGKYVKDNINETQRWRNIKSGNSPLANALNRAEKFLSLGSMLGILLAATAIAVASRRYSQRHQTGVAVFKAMGASKVYITKLYCLHWAFVTISSMLVGLIIGLLLLKLGLTFVSDIFELGDTSLYGKATLMALLTGAICAISFALQPFANLVNTSPMRVLRGVDSTNVKSFFYIGVIIVAIFSLLYLFSGQIQLTIALMLGSAVVIVILLLLSFIVMKFSRQLGSRAGKGWHLALANLRRRAKENSVQLISFTIAINLLLLIVVVKGAMLDEWQAQLQADSANRFLTNLTFQQKEDLKALVSKHQIKSNDSYPVVRGRLAAINGEKVRRKVSKDKTEQAEQGRQGLGRELNLTWREVLPANNEVVKGTWWLPSGDDDNVLNQDKSNVQQVSIEEKLAERLDIVLGDKLTFMIGINEIEVTVTSLREVNWQSMQPNFYMILHPEILSDFPATYITSLFITAQSQPLLEQFLIANPTISMIDVEQLINELRSVIDNVSLALQFILVLVVLAGCLVLVAQVQASMEERERELAILKTLGAKGKTLTQSVFYEFFALGAIAGLMASFAMEIGVYWLNTEFFEMEASLHPEYWLFAIISGSLFVSCVGMLSCRHLLKLSSVTLIRRTL